MSVDVQLKDITADLGGTRILDGVSLAVEPGSFVTLLGPSGSGKTTTLNVVAGFVRQSSGTLEIGGTAYERESPAERNLGIVFQQYALFPHMTIEENVAFPLLARGAGRAERRRRVAEALELVQLGHTARRRTTALSGGQQQRVALARALVFAPSVLLLDEPLAALDKQLRDAMQSELKRVQREAGTTTIAVTHDQTEALTMSDRLAIVNAGRIEQVGAPAEVYARPATLFAARFLGEANVFAIERGEVPALGLRVPALSGHAVVRPEALRLTAPGALRGVVEDVAFQGVRHRVLVRLEQRAAESVVVSAPPLSTPPAVGDTVGIEPPESALHTIPDAAPRAEEIAA